MTSSQKKALRAARAMLVEYRDLLLRSESYSKYVEGSDKAKLDANGRAHVRPVRSAIRQIDQSFPNFQ